MMIGTSGLTAFALGSSSRPLIPDMLMSERIRISDRSAALVTLAYGCRESPWVAHDSIRFATASPPALDLPLDHLQFEVGDRLGRVQILRAGLGAVHDGVAAVQPERILEIVEPLAGGLVSAVIDPAGRLQQRGGA